MMYHSSTVLLMIILYLGLRLLRSRVSRELNFAQQLWPDADSRAISGCSSLYDMKVGMYLVWWSGGIHYALSPGQQVPLKVRCILNLRSAYSNRIETNQK